MNLFQLDPFTLPSGKETHFKIECDVLVEEDWKALARLAVEFLPPFGIVTGVPRGGLAFAKAFVPYKSPTSKTILIADDVWVTGLSMERFKGDGPAVGIVAFNRGILSPWVYSLFDLTPMAEVATYNLNRPHQGQMQEDNNV